MTEIAVKLEGTPRAHGKVMRTMLTLSVLGILLGAVGCAAPTDDEGDSAAALIAIPGTPGHPATKVTIEKARSDYAAASPDDLEPLNPKLMYDTPAKAKFHQSPDNSEVWVLKQGENWVYILVVTKESASDSTIHFYDFRQLRGHNGEMIGSCQAHAGQALSNCVAAGV